MLLRVCMLALINLKYIDYEVSIKLEIYITKCATTVKTENKLLNQQWFVF